MRYRARDRPGFRRSRAVSVSCHSLEMFPDCLTPATAVLEPAGTTEVTKFVMKVPVALA